MGSLGTLSLRDCNAMGDAGNISPRFRSICAQNAILPIPITHIMPSRQIYVAIENPSLVPSITYLTTISYLWNYMRAADNISHTENLQSNCCRCCCHLYKIPHRIQVTWVSRYRCELQGWPVLNESSILVLELDLEMSLQLPWKTPIQHAISPPQGLLYPHTFGPSIPFVPALTSCASKHQRYVSTNDTLNLNLNTMVNTELYWVQSFIRYISLVTTLMLGKLPCAAVCCHGVRSVLHIVE